MFSWDVALFSRDYFSDYSNARGQNTRKWLLGGLNRYLCFAIFLLEVRDKPLSGKTVILESANLCSVNFDRHKMKMFVVV